MSVERQQWHAGLRWSPSAVRAPRSALRLRASILIEPSQLLGRLVDVASKHSKLVAIGDGDLLVKLASRDLAGVFRSSLTGSINDHEMMYPRPSASRMLPTANEATISREVPYAPCVVSIAATMSASAMLTSWFVRRSRRSANGTITAIWALRASSVRPVRTRSTTCVTSAVKRS